MDDTLSAPRSLDQLPAPDESTTRQLLAMLAPPPAADTDEAARFAAAS